MNSNSLILKQLNNLTQLNKRLPPKFEPPDWLTTALFHAQCSVLDRGESASRRPLRSSLNPRPEDTTPAARYNVGLCKEEELDRLRLSSRRGLWGYDTPQREKLIETARRREINLSSWSGDWIAGGPGEHAPGTERTRRRIRVPVGCARPDDPEQQSSGPRARPVPHWGRK